MTLKKIRLLKVAVGKRKKVVLGFVAKLGISKEIAYRYLGPDGELRATAKHLLDM